MLIKILSLRKSPPPSPYLPWAVPTTISPLLLSAHIPDLPPSPTPDGSHMSTSSPPAASSSRPPLKVDAALAQLRSPGEGSFPSAGVMTEEPTPVDEPMNGHGQVHLLKRVLSNGSAGGPSTPPAGAPMSPGSGGARTPKARKAPLHPEPREGEQLASDLDQLKMRSPQHPVGVLPTAAPSLAQAMSATTNGTKKSTRQYSSSTDSSSTGIHPHLPSHLGSFYGPDGFPSYNGSADSVSDSQVPRPVSMNLSAEAAAAVAAADEAIKKLNGTPTVFQGPTTPGAFPQPDNAFLPRGFASFSGLPSSTSTPGARSQPRSPVDQAVSRQSSTSSTTTEASSTSSEESDLCVPSIEWVQRAGVVSPTSGHNLWTAGPVFTNGQNGNPKSPPLRPNNKMGPPISTQPRKGSVTNGSNGHNATPPFEHRNSLPIGATAHTPGGLGQASALPSGLHPDALAEEDDDDVTVGQGREHSPSTSSQSARSGLDLLWRAASGDLHSPSVERSVYDVPGDSKGKRKAGAEAVAQWRNSTVPTGIAPEDRRVKDIHVRQPERRASPPTKKRRRSEIQMEAIDPTLRDDVGEEVQEDEDGSDYRSPESGDVNSEGDSEYQGGSGGRGRKPGAKVKTGRVTKGRVSGGVNAAVGGAQAKAPAKKGRVSNESPSGAASKSRRPSGGGLAAGVQCEYVNPLPPYNRCTDVFTRKYDLPRHMARHGRREGELVYEGLLAEDKALLWKSMKDKPKVSCQVCGESFTR